MLALLILALLRDVAGMTFLDHDGNATRKLICSKSSPKDRTGWWFTGKSLQSFGQQSCNSTVCGEQCDPPASCHTEGEELDFKPRHGGIVACKNLTGTTSNQLPLFSKEEDCKDFDFFMVGRTQNTIKTKVYSKNIPKEEKNLSLSCQFELEESTVTFAVYWIKEAGGSTCLFSASNEDCHNSRVYSYDINCCVDAGIKGRRLKNSTALDTAGRTQSHEITITNVNSSDSGKYLCLVGVFRRPLVWMIVTNISVNVQEEAFAASGFRYVIVGLFLLVGIILILCWRKKSKGKPPEIHQRDQTEMEGDECSPYAISNRNNSGGYEAIYVLATHPGVKPNAADSKLDSGDNLQAIYALVDKKKP
nr:PREDICTED: uncharacterized protein LOC100566515 [Anolis carolinensis]|eukprot:XP_003227481.2 PREDICTED: uncharacterized protein LOC100566515 [Anolis carolinensis]